jgi:hypothetical protein
LTVVQLFSNTLPRWVKVTETDESRISQAMAVFEILVVEAMTITVNPQTEQRLKELALQQNLSVEAVVERMVEREIGDKTISAEQAKPRARNLVELFADSPLRGSGIVIERDASTLRDVSL